MNTIEMNTIAVIIISLAVIVTNFHLMLTDRSVRKLVRTLVRLRACCHTTPHIVCEKKELTP